jgi:hypothetical protein
VSRESRRRREENRRRGDDPDGREVAFLPGALREMELFRPLLDRSWRLWKEKGGGGLVNGYLDDTRFVITATSREGKPFQVAFTLEDSPDLSPKAREQLGRGPSRPDGEWSVFWLGVGPPDPENN